MSTITLDERDQAILAESVAALDQDDRPRVGDWIDFPDGTSRRVSYLWCDEFGEPLANGVQTSAGGSWYLGHGYCSFSGSLFTGVDVSTLELTDETRDGSVWFFHHGFRMAHNGVGAAVAFRVYRCSVAAPTS